MSGLLLAVNEIWMLSEWASSQNRYIKLCLPWNWKSFAWAHWAVCARSRNRSRHHVLFCKRHFVSIIHLRLLLFLLLIQTERFRVRKKKKAQKKRTFFSISFFLFLLWFVFYSVHIENCCYHNTSKRTEEKCLSLCKILLYVLPL